MSVPPLNVERTPLSMRKSLKRLKRTPRTGVPPTSRDFLRDGGSTGNALYYSFLSISSSFGGYEGYGRYASEKVEFSALPQRSTKREEEVRLSPLPSFVLCDDLHVANKKKPRKPHQFIPNRLAAPRFPNRTSGLSRTNSNP
jgi:hypothetical protein